MVAGDSKSPQFTQTSPGPRDPAPMRDGFHTAPVIEISYGDGVGSIVTP